jgi:WD40 repeat protein
MAVKIQCPNPACGRSGSIPRECVGLEVRCPDCHTVFRAIPSADRSAPAAYPVARPFAPAGEAGAGAPAAEAPLPARIGRFQIRAWLGRGGFGDVYRAYDPQLEREVALKVPRADTLDRPARVERFLREARSAARLRHPHIVPVYESGHDGAHYYIASAFIKGRPLSRALEDGPLDCRRAARVARQLAEALAYAHGLDIVHRDVKPDNVMLDDKDQPHLVDFGLAYRLGDHQAPEGAADPAPGPGADERLTNDRAVLGTPAYMAPEQWAGRQDEVRAASDQYSLGVLLYELLCGQTPFGGPQQILRIIAKHTPPPPPREVRPEVPPDLEAVCLKALAKRPGDRYPDCRALAEDLRRWLDGEETRARPWGARERWLNWCRREPARARAVGLAAAAVVALFVLAVVFAVHQSWAARRIGEEKERAEQKGEEAQEFAREAQKKGRLAQASAVRAAESAKQARDREQEAKRLSAESVLDQGQMLCEQGETGKGMQLLARGLDLAARAGADDLQDACRLNLAAWRRRTHPLRACWPQDKEPFFALAFGPDGRSALVGRRKGVVRLDLLTGREAGNPLPHPAPVRALALTPDRKAAFTGADDGLVRLWDLGAGTERAHFPRGHAGPVTCVAVDRGGRVAVSGGADGTVRLWDLQAGRQVRFLRAHQKAVRGLAFSPCGEAVLTGGSDGAVLLWELGARGPAEDRPARAPAAALLWELGVGDPAEDRPARVLVRDPGKSVGAVAYGPSGASVGVARGAQLSGEAQLWSVAGELLATFPHQAEVYAAAFSPDGTILLTAGQDRSARLWQVGTGGPLGRVLWHPAEVRLATFSPGGRFVLTGGADGALRLWEVAEDRPRAEVVERPVTAVAVRPDGQALLAKAGLLEGGTTILARGTGQPLERPLRPEGHVSAVARSADGKTFLTGSVSHTKDGDRYAVQAWDAASGALRRTWPDRHEDLIFRAAFSPDGPRPTVATASFDGTARLRGLADEWWVPLPHRGEAKVYALAYSPDGRLLATGGTDGYARVWDVDTGKPVDKLKHPDAVLALAFGEGGRTLLTGYVGAAQLWRKGKNGRWEAYGPPLQHPAGLLAVAVSPDGRLLATGGTDRAVRLWHRGTWKPVGPPLPHGAPVLAAAFAPNGRTLVTAAFDKGRLVGSVRRWDVPGRLGGAVQELDRWVQTVTAIRLGESGNPQALDGPTWADLRARPAGPPEDGWQDLLGTPAAQPPTPTPYAIASAARAGLPPAPGPAGPLPAAADWVKYLPDDTGVVVHLDVQQILGSELVRGRANLAGGAGGVLGALPQGALVQKAFKAAGLDPARDLVSVTFVMPADGNAARGAVFVRGRFDPAKLQAAALELAGELGARARVAGEGLHAVLEFAAPQQESTFLALASQDTLVLSSTREGLNTVLVRAGGPRKAPLPPEIQELVTGGAAGQGLGVAVTAKALAQLPGVPGLSGLASATSLRGSVAVQKDVRLHFTLGAKDVKTANDLKAELTNLLTDVLPLVPQGPVADALRRVQVGRKDTAVTVQAHIPPDVARRLLEEVFRLPR